MSDRLKAYEALLEMGGSMYRHTDGFWCVSDNFRRGETVYVHGDDPTAAILLLYEQWKAGESKRQKEAELGREAAEYCGVAA